ncbi:MAG: FAD-binding oxidoreductase [Deltaproteobacteria bacterium]|nr:FAD-binding oxidoreductase [Deltaproteobacteria bacterium]
MRDILILEQERLPGVHSSGRNAAMVRQVVSEPVIAELALKSAAFLRSLPVDWPVPVLFQRNGSLLLGSGEGWGRLLKDAEVARQKGIEAEIWSPEKAKERVCVLEDADFEGAVWCPADGIVDIHALLTGYLKAAAAQGAEIRYGCPVSGLEVKAGRVTGVRVPGETIRAAAVINAAGPWASVIGRLAGAIDAPLRPCRRHLFVSVPLAWVDPAWPFVWDVTHDLYFRPEAGGLLLCPCDQEETAPGDPPLDDWVTELLAEKIRRFVPRISDIAIKKRWAGLRTLSPDGRFAIGWDPRITGFFWVAGLGGHGVTTSYGVGGLAADLILGGSDADTDEFSLARFLT